MELWIPITIGAAFFQNLRSTFQQRLRDRLSLAGATYTRFIYALPPVVLYTWCLHTAWGFPWPAANITFITYGVLGAVCQIMFTLFLLWMFSFRSFAVGTTFSKLEVIMVALLGAMLLGDTLGAAAWLAVALSAGGVFLLGAARSEVTWGALRAGWSRRPTYIGLASAAWLGASVVMFRGAALSLENTSQVMAAACTLLLSLLVQTVLLGAYLAWAERGELTRIRRHWREGGAAGLAAAIASVGWFTAFTMQNAAYIRALGQVELVFAYLATTWVFRQAVRPLELGGIALVSGGILLLLIRG